MSPSRGGKVRGDSFLSRGGVEIFPVATDYERVRASIADRGGLCVTLPKLGVMVGRGCILKGFSQYYFS